MGNVLSRAWHHVAESNWINFVVAGLIMWYVYGLMVANGDKDRIIAQQEMQLELNKEAMSVIANDVYNRLDNIDNAKAVQNQIWNGVRKKEY